MLTLLLLTHLAEAKKTKGPPPAPPVGWHKEEGWKGECYFPPEYDKLLEGDRKLARQRALEGMKLQWSGGKDETLSFDAGVVDDVETTLLGRPVAIESVSLKNLEMCRAVMTGGDTAAWQAWLSSLPSSLTAGECNTPLTYTLFDYLDIGHGWQRPVHICKGNKAKITTTVKDRYRITEKGEWINSEGTPEKATQPEYPCNIEGCTVGMVVGKFVTDDGVETIFPIGAGTVFVAPEHGTLYYTVNDTTWYDNKWFKSSTVEDKTAITIEPVE
jgi:hypothetical protein